jgi:hypothetical protein
MNFRKLATDAPELFEQIMKKFKGGADDVITKADDVTMIPKTNPLEVPPSQIIDDVPNPSFDFDPSVPTPKKGMSTTGKVLTGAGTVAGGAGVMSQMTPEESKPFGLLESAAISAAPAVVNNLMNPAPKQELPRTPAVEQSPIPQPVNQVPVENDYLSMLKAAQQGQNDQDLINNMLRAGTTIGSAIAGTKADYSGVDALAKQSGKGVDNVKGLMTADMDSKKLKKVQQELDDEKTLRDPNSNASKAFKSVMSKLGMQFDPKTTSAWDAKAVGINPQNFLMHEKTIEASKVKADAKSKKDVDGFVTGAQKMLQKPFQQYQKVANARNSLQSYLQGGSSGPKDVAILYDFIKGLDPESAVREGEISLGQSAMSIFDKYGIKAKKLTKGDILSPAFRQAISGIMDMKETQAKESYTQLAQPFLFEAAKRGIPEEDYARFDYLSASEAKKQKADGEQPASQQGMVKVQRISDGATKMMPADKAAQADKSKYKVIQ